ncbi:MAG: helix-turn-helix transcriptional regulator [Methylocystaceae bacterium]|nr:helix-turn-helix transcriptional regulator [Methylocystaceae bacterium]
MISASQHLNKYISKGDLIQKTGYRSDFNISPDLPGQENMLRGNIDFFELQEGLSVHFSNACDLQNLEIIRECKPRLCISYFLEGSIEAYIGDDQIPMPVFDETTQTWSPVASMFSQCKTELFKRYAKRGSFIKKIVITMTPQWLEKFNHLSPEFSQIQNFSETHLARKNWTPSAHSIAIVEQIITSANMPEIMRRLYVESRALMLVEEAFRELIGFTPNERLSNIRPQDRDRLKAIEHYLQNHVGHQISTKELADEIGISVNSLQRLIARAYDISASKFIRTFMLERARTCMERDGISISEAAYIAGYNSPANFATAFKKCFGFSPSGLSEI